jgi:hypothetical protein
MPESDQLVHSSTDDGEVIDVAPKASRSSARHVISSAKAQAMGGACTRKRLKKQASKPASASGSAPIAKRAKTNEETGNVNLMLMSSARERSKGDAVGGDENVGGRTKCWCHQHFVAQDELGEWTVAITEENLHSFEPPRQR